MAKLAYSSSTSTHLVSSQHDNSPPKLTLAPPLLQPCTISMPNGVTLFNINSPDNNGVSYNRCVNFNVDMHGIILNNAKLPGPTKLGGYTKYNSQLKTSCYANTIILHVVGPLPSKLEGYLEVAGAPAQVVIANTQNINCESGGFINTSSVRLITGTPTINQAEKVCTYNVTQGHIQIGSSLQNKTSLPLNWSNLAVNLLSRAVTVNTQLKVADMNVVTGSYNLSHTMQGVEDFTVSMPKNTSSPSFEELAINIKPVACIEAELLRLKSLEKNMRIKSAGSLKAENITIESQQNLVITGFIKTHNVRIQAEDTLIQKGKIESANELKLESNAYLTHTGTTQSKKLVITAPNVKLEGQLEGDNLHLKSDELWHKGKVMAKGSLEAKAKKRFISSGDWHVVSEEKAIKTAGKLRLESDNILESSGIHHSTGTIHIEGKRLQLNESILHAKDELNLTAREDDIELNNADTKSSRTIINTPLSLYHRESKLWAAHFELAAAALFNIQGTVFGKDAMRMNFTYRANARGSETGACLNGLDNRDGLIHTTKNLKLEAPTIVFNNIKGHLFAGGALELQVAAIDNEAGRLQAKEAVTVRLNEWESQGTLQSKDAIYLDCKKQYTHTNPDVFKAPNLFLETNSFINQATLNGPQLLQVKAAQFYNKPQAVVNGAEVQFYIEDPITHTVYADNPSEDNSDALEGQFALVKRLGKKACSGAEKTLLNSSETESSLGYLENEGRIVGAHIHLRAHKLTNKATLIREKTKEASTVKEYTGIIDARGPLYLGANNLNNLPGSLVRSEEAVRIGGAVDAEGNIIKNAEEVINHAVIYGKEVTIESDNLSNENSESDILKEDIIGQVLPDIASTSLIKESTTLQPRTLSEIEWLPKGEGFQFLGDKKHAYLVEVDPNYLKTSKALMQPGISSDYLLKDKLQLTKVAKRLGNGLYEQEMVSTQLKMLTPENYFTESKTDGEIFKSLMEAAHAQSDVLNLMVGKPLTEQQIKGLKQDIVWMVEQEVTLPSGQKHTVLTPKVYLALKNQLKGAVIAADQLNLEVGTLENNASTFFSKKHTLAKVGNFKSERGQFTSHGGVELNATGGVKFLATKLGAEEVNIKGGDITIGKVTLSRAGQSHHEETQELDIGTQIHANTFHAAAKADVACTASQIVSKKKLKLKAQGSVRFTPGQHLTVLKKASKKTDSGVCSTTTFATKQTSSTVVALDNALLSKNVSIEAGGDVKGKGLQMVGTESVAVKAVHDIALQAAVHSVTSEKTTDIEKSGMEFSWRRGLFLGSRHEKIEENETHKQHNAGNIHTEGSLVMGAERSLSIKGYDLQADQIKVSGSDVNIEEAVDTQTTKENTESTKSGLYLGLGGGLASMLSQADKDRIAAEESQSMKLSLAKAAHSSYGIVSNYLGGDKNRTRGVDYKALVDNTKALKGKEALAASAVDGGTSIGFEENKSQVDQGVKTARLNRITAGEVEVEALKKDLKISGSKVKANKIALAAEGGVTVEGAVNTFNTNQSAKHQEVNVGVSAGYKGVQGFIEVQASEQNAFTAITQGQQSSLAANEILEVKAKGSVELTGVKASGKKVIAEAGKDFTVKSIQDTKTEGNNSSGLSCHIGMPIGVTGMASLHGGVQVGSMSSGVANVESRTTLEAGEGGFEINVGEKTQLIGAGIESKADPAQNKLTSGSLAYEDIKNTADHESSQYGAQWSQGYGLGTALLNNTTSNATLLTSQPKQREGITGGSLSAAQLDIKQNNQEVKPSFKHETVEAYDHKKEAENAELQKITGELGMLMSGDAVQYTKWKRPDFRNGEHEALRIGLHAATAGVSAALGESSVTSAIAGVIAGDLATLPLGDSEKIGKLGKEASSFARSIVSGLGGAAAGALFEGKSGALNGAGHALIADAWNRQLHSEEKTALTELIKGKSPEEEKRFKEAAAYLTHGSKAVTKGDPKKEKIKAMEERGKGHTEELRALQATNLFKYARSDEFRDWLLCNDEEVQKGVGLVHGVGGIVATRESLRLMMAGIAAKRLQYALIGGGLTGLAVYGLWEVSQKLIERYRAKEGERVLEGLDLAVDIKARDPVLELGIEGAKMAGPWAVMKAARKAKQVLGGAGFFSAKKGAPKTAKITIRENPLSQKELEGLMVAARQPYKGEKMTVAAQAMSKHPKYFKYDTYEDICAVYRTVEARNQFAEKRIREILTGGIVTTGASGRFKGGWMTIIGENGIEVSFYSNSKKWIGFRKFNPNSKPEHLQFYQQEVEQKLINKLNSPEDGPKCK